MRTHRKLAKAFFERLPSYNPMLYELCSRYVDRYNGDNNSDSATNGEYAFLSTVLKGLDRGVVFDVGANVGNWAQIALELDPACEVHCFEPSSSTFQMLINRTWPSNVHLNNLGLGEAEGTLELNVVDPGSALNSLYRRRGVEVASARGVEHVRITTFDDYCEGNGVGQIALAKVDVEGHELAVFRGMKRMLEQRRVQRIQFEYGGCNLDARVTLGDIWEYLASFGFEFYKLYPEGPRHIARYTQSLESFKYSNWVALLSG
jgi:FkbM family methyltransferase